MLMQSIRRWWRQLVERLRPPSPPPKVVPVVAPKVVPVPDITPLLAMDIPPPPPAVNRHQRRVLERARRRHDRFVEPKGPQPVKHEREHVDKLQPKIVAASPVAPAVEDVFEDPNDRPIAGEWLEGDGECVLYEEAEFYGEFNFRDTILDQLDRYWVYLERMRKHDAAAYGFYKQLGATLIPYAATNSMGVTPHRPHKLTAAEIKQMKKEIVLPAWFRHHWPAFGCCAYGTNPRDEAASLNIPGMGRVQKPKFLYFRRVKRMPWTVQPTRGGKLYVLTVWWDHVDHHNRWKWGRPQEFPIQISDDGTRMRVLKTRTKENGDIGPWWDWQIPHEYEEWSRQYGLDPQTHLCHTFCSAVQHVELAAYSMLRVEVSKGDLTAVFGLSPRRASYFFQDRDIVLNDAGAKKRMFHIVRPHVRKDGAVVPAHFRGLREFDWAGYRVCISVPGRDHFMPLEFDVPSVYLDPGERADGITEVELGRRLKSAIKHGDVRQAFSGLDQ